MVNIENNNAHSATIQVLRDLRAACVTDPDAVAKIDALAAALDLAQIERADDSFCSHQYPDTSRAFARLMMPAGPSLVDSLSPDALFLCVWLVRRLCGFGQYVAFRANDLAPLIGWGTTKMHNVLIECKRVGALLPVDDSMARTPVGTVYMIAPVLLDNSGKRSGRDASVWRDLMAETYGPDASQVEEIPAAPRPTSISIKVSDGVRASVACVCMPAAD